MKAYRRRSFLVTFVAMAASGVFAGVGCSSGEPRTTVDGRANRAQAEAFKVVHLDSSFAGKVAVENVNRRSVDGFLQVQVTLVSTTSSPTMIETSWEWYDRGGFLVDSGRNAWLPAELGGRTSMEIRGVAPRAGIEDFKFHVRASMPIAGEE